MPAAHSSLPVKCVFCSSILTFFALKGASRRCMNFCRNIQCEIFSGMRGSENYFKDCKVASNTFDPFLTKKLFFTKHKNNKHLRFAGLSTINLRRNQRGYSKLVCIGVGAENVMGGFQKARKLLPIIKYFRTPLALNDLNIDRSLLQQINLKPVKSIEFSFSPFFSNTYSIR